MPKLRDLVTAMVVWTVAETLLVTAAAARGVRLALADGDVRV